jgi:hypothetical protein
MDDVAVHHNSPKPADFGALAYTKGIDIHLAPGQDKHLPHEGWHVVQQKQGRVKGTIQAKGEAINDDRRLEREADLMGERALRAGSGREGALSSTPRRAQAGSAAVIQRVTYDELVDPKAKAKVDQWADEMYADKAQEFEFKMSPLIMNNPAVNGYVDRLLARVRRIVTAWANKTGQSLGEAYVKEFSWRGGDDYYGAFDMTAQNIHDIFRDKSQPMRAKLKIVYNAVRNNNLSKWLKLAAIELDREVKGKTPRDWKIKQTTGARMGRDSRGRPKAKKAITENLTVKTGFAQESGLEDWMTPAQVRDTARLAEGREKGGSKRNVFKPDQRSDVLKWKQSMFKAHGERSGGASSGLSMQEQRTLTVGDVADLTDAEIDQLFKQRGQPKPTDIERQQFRSDPSTKISWGQGGEYYNIDLRSESAQTARSVRARLEAGISGSTDLMIHAIQYLGFRDADSLRALRLALAGWMMANRDHSFYEIYKAAQAYGVPFEIDPAEPGKEYESDSNLFPMSPANFSGILGNNRFPRYFLGPGYKNHLANYIETKGVDVDFATMLTGQGVTGTTIGSLDVRAQAEVARLGQVVAKRTIDIGDSPAKKGQDIRRIKQHPSYIYLASSLPRGEAEALLTSLLKEHHSGKRLALDDQDYASALIGAGVPVDILNAIPKKKRILDIKKLEYVRRMIAGAEIHPTRGTLKNIRAVNSVLKKTSLNRAKRNRVRDILTYAYHRGDPNAQDVDEDAVEARNVAIIENVAQMQKTSGWWYTWGNLSWLAGFETAPSIRDYAYSQSFSFGPQGQGQYVANTAYKSERYGDSPGNRMMAVHLSGVPTISKENASQLQLLVNRGVITRPNTNMMYKKFKAVEILLYYEPNIGWGRLTTNEGVMERTVDLKRPPVDDLRYAYSQMTYDGTKRNFRQQALASGLDISTW